ncbi:MAG: adenylate/guanylate cyclase domain-containing protein [Ginsengibacter sp.]
MNLSKVICLTIFFFLPALNAHCQDQKIADSLVTIFRQNSLKDTAQLELLRNLSFNESRDLNLSLQYAEELIRLAKKEGNDRYLHAGYFQKGNKERLLGDLDEALKAYFNALEVSKKINRLSLQGSDYGAIAAAYSESKDATNSMLYFHKAISTLRQIADTDKVRQANDSIQLASAILNAGDELRNNGNYDSALIYFNESKKIFEKKNYPVGVAYNLGNTGMVYAAQGKDDLASQNMNEAITILQQQGDFYPICVYLISISDIYTKKGDHHKALDYALESLKLAQQHGLKEQIAGANQKLSQLYQSAGNIPEAYQYYKDYIIYRDSVVNLNTVQKMADMRTNYEVSQKQVQVDLLKQQKRNQWIIMVATFVILGLTIGILVLLYRFYKKIAKEKKVSETLLLNILPAETAKELKQNGKVEAVKLDEVTVLFTDFVQFTRAAENTNPVQLVKSIDYYFKGFDQITLKYGLEKIKTIGDSYMCACGLPTPNQAHAQQVVQAAKEMIALVNDEFTNADDLNHFEIRIGIHTGPVVAGIVGIKKWQYDIWGDTVNIASRMEANSTAGRINLSESTYKKIKDEFPCEYRGEIQVKNHDSVKMYFLL